MTLDHRCPAISVTLTSGSCSLILYREDFCFVDWFYVSALHGSQCVACCKAHTNFADESAYLMADNIWNEGEVLPLFTDHRRCWKYCPPTHRHSMHRWKMFCRNICSFSVNIFFQFSCLWFTVERSSFKQPQKKKIARIKIGWLCWPNTTADNSVPEDLRQSLHRHCAVWAVAESCWNQP
jgi:hypothetical protein